LKKTIVILFLVVLVFALLCGCTSPEKDTEAAQQGTGLPDPQTGHIQTPDTTPSEQGNAAKNPETEVVTETVSDQSSDSGSPFEDEPDLETASDYVVDGGEGFGFGGN